jgi:hypothetical protein
MTREEQIKYIADCGENLCPTCAQLGIQWLKAVEERDALDASMADVALKAAGYLEAHRAFMAYVLRQRNCTECVRSVKVSSLPCRN